jgi:hypothetical protein
METVGRGARGSGILVEAIGGVLHVLWLEALSGRSIAHAVHRPSARSRDHDPAVRIAVVEKASLLRTMPRGRGPIGLRRGNSRTRTSVRVRRGRGRRHIGERVPIAEPLAGTPPAYGRLSRWRRCRVSRNTRPMKCPMRGRQPGHHTTPAFTRERARRSPTPALLPWTTSGHVAARVWAPADARFPGASGSAASVGRVGQRRYLLSDPRRIHDRVCQGRSKIDPVAPVEI